MKTDMEYGTSRVWMCFSKSCLSCYPVETLPTSLRKNRLDNFPVDVGQPPLDAVVVERQLLVVQPEQVQDRRVQVVDRRHVIDRLVAELVRRPVTERPLD